MESDGIIKSGYCMVVRDFWAECVPFETVMVYDEINTIPFYEVELPNGVHEEYNEPDLRHTKEEVENFCNIFNEEHKEDRERLIKILPSIKQLNINKVYGVKEWI